ncbi:sialoadhesin-like [Centropristis striata]|uniref:sialoadhesin-like n=1 Tax=Centropristis striata TaxID=184440 RepID=UPI0027E0F913|nr:sialoadhesin-like [Centropristis striata]
MSDLQVKVLPTTEGQTVTLMCSTSCPLTENPAVYIWYKNGESLYQDWSPWYQELVSSEEAVRYSCAIKGYEDLRAPEVSVDSVTPTCISVTYAKGRVCPYNQTSVDEPCSITYPTEVHSQRTQTRHFLLDKEYIRLTCTPSCPQTDLQTAYRWYLNKRLYRFTESQNLTVYASGNAISCAVKGHEDLRSDEVCAKPNTCMNYVSRTICALEGSSVNISRKYVYPYESPPLFKLWYKRNNLVEDVGNLTGRLVYHDYILKITNLSKSDSGEFAITIHRNDEVQTNSAGIALFVTELKVTFTPSAVVTEDQRVTLTCSTSCPLTNNTNYIWFFNSRPLTLTENQNKHLVLDPVSSQHAGNYSCAVKTQTDIRSPEESLTVEGGHAFSILLNYCRH